MHMYMYMYVLMSGSHSTKPDIPKEAALQRTAGKILPIFSKKHLP